MSKETSLSLPENLWLRPPPSQSLSFVSISPFLPTAISSLSPAELPGEVWVGMDAVQAGERPRSGSAPRTATWPAIYRMGPYRLLLGWWGGLARQLRRSGCRQLGWGLMMTEELPVGPEMISPMEFSFSFSPKTLNHHPLPSAPVPFLPCSAGFGSSYSLPLQAPLSLLQVPGHSVPPPQALTSVSCGSFWLGSHRRLWWGSSTCTLCDLGQVSTPPL